MMKSFTLLLLGSSLSVAHAATDSLDTVRNTINEWATTEKAISRESLNWQSDKVLLQDMIQVAEQRVAQLETTIAEGENLASAADKERLELLDRSEGIAAKTSRIQSQILWLESKLQSLLPRLPDPLKEELEALFQRIPSEAQGESTVSLGERMQNVTSIIAKIRQFDGAITVSESIRKLPGNETEAAFRTVWIGLGQAYYLAPNDAGYGLATADGWSWHSQVDLADEIQNCIELLEGSQSTPQLISLPVNLQIGAAE